MPSLRVLAALLTAAVALAGPHAANAASCRAVVTDPAGDARMAPTSVNRGEMDLLAADLAADRKTLTVSAKLGQVSATPVPPRVVDVLFGIGRHHLNAYVYQGAEGTIYGFNNASGGHAVTGTLDAAAGVVRIRVPRRLLPAGSTVSFVEVFTTELYGTNEMAYGTDYDSAGVERAFPLVRRGCL